MLNRLYQGAITARAWASVRLVMTVSLSWRVVPMYVCQPTYYEGRHTDMQLIFPKHGKSI
jgi:hypothetical protein